LAVKRVNVKNILNTEEKKKSSIVKGTEWFINEMEKKLTKLDKKEGDKNETTKEM